MLFRRITFALAVILACQAIWLLIAELCRPSYPGFPVDAKTAELVAGKRNAAALAASFGFMRGDLWTEYSLTYLNLFWNDGQGGTKQNSGVLERARDVAVRALALAPHDARGWLALSTVNFELNGDKKSTALLMSYFTGANEIELIPMRLLLAVRSDTIGEKDFQLLVRHDIRAIITYKPELKSAIVAAYRDALPVGKQFLEDVLKELDPSLLTKLHQSG
jgi:hypothetical protein